MLVTFPILPPRLPSDGSLRKLTYIAQGAGSVRSPRHLYPAHAYRRCVYAQSVRPHLPPLARFERFLDAKKRNDDESQSLGRTV